jgi:hypothetical protein
MIMFHSLFQGFFLGLGFCAAIALTVGFSELKAFVKRNYDSNVMAWRERQKNQPPVATPVPPVVVAPPVVANDTHQSV